MDARARRHRQVQWHSGRISEFRADSSCGLASNSWMIVAVGAKPDVEFLECIVVDKIELNVLVASAFTASGVGPAQKIELGSLADIASDRVGETWISFRVGSARLRAGGGRSCGLPGSGLIGLIGRALARDRSHRDQQSRCQHAGTAQKS